MMRLLVGPLAAVLLLAGCSASPDTPLLPENPDTVQVGPPAGDRVPQQPTALTPTDGLVDVRPTSFDSAEVVSEDDRTLNLRFHMGVPECYGLDRVEVEESAQDVVVTIYTGRRPQAEMCIEMAVQANTEVVLDAPLGGRAIVDGSTEASEG